MKHVIAVCLSVVVVLPAYGAIVEPLDAPQDSREIRDAIKEDPEVASLRHDYNTFQEAHLWPLLASETVAVFGKKLSKLPRGYVLPVFEPLMFVTTGLLDGSKPDKTHRDLYAIDQLGYVELVFNQDGERLHAALLYFREDTDFVPLKSKADLTARLNWERKKWELVKNWLVEHLPRK